MRYPLSYPEEFAFQSDPLRVCLFGKSTWDWGFAFDGKSLASRIRVNSVSCGLNEDFPRAELSLDLTGQWDDEGNELRPQLGLSDVERLLKQDKRLCVFAQVPAEIPGGGQDTRVFVFDGYPMVPEFGFSETSTRIDFTATSLLEAEGRRPQAWVSGRVMYNRLTTVSRFIEATPCIFNWKGTPNRYHNPSDPGSDFETVRGVTSVPRFTYEGDPNARAWTYADALRYLLAHYFGWGGIIDGNGDNLTETAVVANAGPTKLPSPNTVKFSDIIRQQCDELTVEGMNIVDALLAWCRQAGCVLQQITGRDDSGDPATRLVFSVIDEGGPYATITAGTGERSLRSDDTQTPPVPRSIQLEQVGSAFRSRRPDEVLRHNEIARGRVAFDAQNRVKSCTVVGAPELYEVTAGKLAFAPNPDADAFRPGWVPDSMFGDDLSGDALDAKLAEIEQVKSAAVAGNPGTMYARYVKGGEHFTSHATTGRFWVLNESGEYDGATYGRQNGGATVAPWESDDYVYPYDFNAMCRAPFAIDRRAGRRNVPWIPRRRKMLPLLSIGPDGADVPPIILASWDSGSHWYVYPRNVRIAEDQCAIYLTDPNLAAIKCPGDPDDDSSADMSAWAAIVSGTFRIAATFSVEGDSRLIRTAVGRPGGLPSGEHAVLHLPQRYELKDPVTPNSMLNLLPEWTSTLQDGGDEAQSLADRYVAANQVRKIAGNVEIPWMTKRWLPGDLIKGIYPRGPDFAATAGSDRYPQVTRVQWVNGQNGESTIVTLGDSRTSSRVLKT